MAKIMCAQKLWRALHRPGRPPLDATEPLVPGAALGSWAATVFGYEHRDLVLALDERTYLTLVFALEPAREFRTAFASALSVALDHLGVPPQAAFIETAVVELAPLTRLSNKSLIGTLSDLKFHCGIELEYHTDLHRVQANLNEIPHANRDPCVPIDAVAVLFGDGGSMASFRPH